MKKVPVATLPSFDLVQKMFNREARKASYKQRNRYHVYEILANTIEEKDV